MRAIANMTVVVPCDPVETEQAVRTAAEFVGPIFLRISRMGVPIINDAGYHFQIGKATVLQEGTDVTLIANGVMVIRALEAAKLLSQSSVSARVINMATVRPIDQEAIIAAALETGAIVTVEEHTVYGGLGSAIAEVVCQNAPVSMRILGVPGVFAPTGETEWLLEYFNLTAQGICTAALEVIESKSKNGWGQIHSRH